MLPSILAPALFALAEPAAVAVERPPEVLSADPGATIRVDPRWQERRALLRGATIGAGVGTGLALVGMAISGGVTIASTEQEGGRAKIALATTGALFGVSAIAAVAFGIEYQRHLVDGRAPLWRTYSHPWRDPAWLARDRRMTRWTIGLGVMTGSGIVMTAAGVSWFFHEFGGGPCDDCGAADPVRSGIFMLTGATITGIGLLAFTGVAVARGVHRAPQRRWRAGLTPGGLTIRS